MSEESWNDLQNEWRESRLVWMTVLGCLCNLSLLPPTPSSLASLERQAQLACGSQSSQLTSDSALGSESSVMGRTRVREGGEDASLPINATTGVPSIDTVSYF